MGVKFSQGKQVFHPRFNQPQMGKPRFSNVITIESDPKETYKGEYTIRPAIEEQSMQTKDKLMVNDVTIEAIPLYSVSNEHNGETIIIGV